MYLVISTSLNRSSRSRVLANEAYVRLRKRTDEVELADLQRWNLPQCDGGDCYGHEQVQRLAHLVRTAGGIIVAAPIYNYDVGAAAKNVVELTGEAWSDKVVGFACAAGGNVSYMGVMGLANSLMLDFRSLIIPRFVFATAKAFDQDNRIVDENILQRLDDLATALIKITRALQ